MTARAEQLLLVIAPAVALAAVALGLRLGAGTAVRAAVVFGARPAAAGTALAWQAIAFDEDHGMREPVTLPDLTVTARAGGREVRWNGATNEDGTAEVLLALPSVEGIALEVRSGAAVLASGPATRPPDTRSPPGPASAWARYARREGQLALDVAILGQRGASGFPASIWVRATDATTRAPIAGAVVDLEHDASLSPAASDARTDARGWAHLIATPMGYAVALIVHARAPDGRAGTWAGGLLVSPGAAQIKSRDRYRPDEEPVFEVVVPNLRKTVYLEIDDPHGRAWATTTSVAPADREMPRAEVRVPPLPPGLYWAVTSSDPSGAATLGPGTMARPFVVAETDSTALTFGTEPDECAPPGDVREAPRVLALCLALAGATPTPRWTALEGFTAQHARDADRRRKGLTVALGAIAVAVALELVLLVRAAHWARRRIDEAGGEASHEHAAPPGALGVALLVALLGFALLAAFLVRVG
jgi:hypothetical protein